MTYIPRLVCTNCRLDMRPSRTGYILQVSLPDGTPYYKVAADTYECPDCGISVAYISPHTDPMAYGYEERFGRFKHDGEVILRR